jgi:hypothetical protein
MALKKTVLLEAAATLYQLRVEGKKDAACQEFLGLDADDYAEVQSFLLESRAETHRTRPREHVYVEYELETRKAIHDLDTLITNLDANSQYNALIGAIRLRADLVDRIVAKGQEFGLLKKQAERRELVGGIVIAELGMPELKGEIVKQARLNRRLLEEFGDKDFMALPPGEIHYGEAFSEAAGDEDDDEALVTRRPAKAVGTARARTAKRSAGRKVVKDR